MKRCFEFFATVSVLFFSLSAFAASHWTNGKIVRITSIQGGLLIALDGGSLPRPDNCAAATSSWYMISQDDKIIVSVAMIAHMKNKDVSVYTSGVSGGYCVVTQVDPGNLK